MKKVSKVLTMALCCSFALSPLAACGGTSANFVDFWVYGDEAEIVAYQAMVDQFNATYGKEHGIEAKMTSKTPGGYDTALLAAAGTISGPDVFIDKEDNIKKGVNSGLIANITQELAAVEGVDTSDIYGNVLSRYHYDKTDNSSEAGDPLYGLPLDTRPSALYYNETLFREAGILVISVDEEDIDEFWNGTKADNRGLTKADYVAKYKKMQEEGLVNASAVAKLESMDSLPAKGYYRERPMYGGAAWSQPSSGEVLIFNNRIPMNWDEAEDLALLFTPSACSLTDYYRNNKGKLLKETTNGTVEYGFFTEWWFMYGWSVGGDCLNDLTGKGDLDFSLLDDSANYIVASGETYVGEYTGTVYQAGETIEFLDKMDVAEGETVVANNDGTYKHADGKKLEVRSSVASSEKLNELPSTRKAFERYIRVGASKKADIGSAKGLGISPYPTLFSTRKDYNYFFSGKLAMLVQYSVYMPMISEYMADYGFDFDIAPLLVYKEYENPQVATDDTVKVEGKAAGQSTSIGLFVRGRSEKKEKAAAFVAWMASANGQKVKTEHGFFPNQAELLDDVDFKSGVVAQNVVLFKENMEYQTAGDWWYLEDYEWINTWAQDLNAYVRNGTMEYNTWAQKVVLNTNTILKSY